MNQLRVWQPELMAEYGSKIEKSRVNYSRYGFCLSLGDYDSNTYAVAVPFRVPETGETMVFNCAIRLGHRDPDELRRHLINDIAPSLLSMVQTIKQVMNC